MKCSRRQIIRRRSVSFLEFYDHFLGVAAKRHLFAIPTRRRSVSSVWSFTSFRSPFGCRRRATPICNSDQAAVGVANLEFYIFSITFACRRKATRNINSDQAAVGFGFKCRREATGKSAADEGNEPFRHPSKSFCALDVE